MEPNPNLILLCMDLDRTALPNGRQEESPQARTLLRRVASHPEVAVAYVSGRRKELQLQAIKEFDLPEPDYSIGDVGTSIYEVVDGMWKASRDWQDEIARSWKGRTAGEVEELLQDIAGLRLQEPEAQSPFKLSYFAASDLDHPRVRQQIQERLQPAGFQSSLIWSVDETTDVGLLDVLPERATKLHAVRFLMQKLGVDERRMVYAGDSGNDLPVLTSGLQAVLVANAIAEVRDQATAGVQSRGCPERLYIARGGFLGMNGNYSAGILEGLTHFLPETSAWLE